MTGPIPELRERVAALDAQLIRLLASRLEITDSIGREKRMAGIPVYDPETERVVLQRARSLASQLGISESFAEAVMRAAMAEARLRQDSVGMAGAANSKAPLSRYIPPPMDFKGAVPLSPAAEATVAKARQTIRNILDGHEDRQLVVLGPCSIHDTGEALEYARRVAGLQAKVSDSAFLVMRAYVEKGRSGTGWTGFLADPRLDGSGDVQEGITKTRMLLNRMGEMGVPAAVEFINPLVPAYIGDLVSWAAVGARSSGSQIHRDMASGLEMPVGFKNGLDGRAESAVGAVASAAASHDFIGLDHTGHVSAFKTPGNRHCHIVLRGGDGPNFDEHAISLAQKALASSGLRENVMVDCSHGNSGKVASNQAGVLGHVLAQRSAGNAGIVGVMLESYIQPGRQELKPGELRPGISVTDECMGWEETESLIAGLL